MNLIDRTNKMVLRNIKALQDLNMGSLSIRADQVNIAQNQLNQVVKGKRKPGSRSSSKKLSKESSTK